MTSFTFTTGNPNNLVANQNASMADIQGPFTDLRTFLNGGTMDETNVPNLAAAFTTWKTVGWGGATPGSAAVTGAGPWLMSGPASPNVGGAVVAVGATANAERGFRLDPADWTANARTTKLRIRWQLLAGTTAPGVTITAGMYPISGYGGATPAIASLGTVVAGSTAVFTTPATGSNTVTVSSEFNAPAAGDYVLGFASSGAFAGGAIAILFAHLQMRQV